ncbi:MAG: hypothetical protein KatS3mg057_3202 [Herpetosiphonaceae bacterium]|nr:MAG: hypothetical protein KatS3mg057_3202 [Herpetosiphonaceae bacterium]
MTVSPTHSAWQAVATLAALTYTPIGQAESLGDRLTAILSSELPYRQGAILLGQGAPLHVAGSWGLTDADLESLRRHPPVRSGNGLPAPTQEGWQGIELQALGETIGVLALRGLDDTALPEDLLLALAGQVALLCFAGYVAEHEPEATQQVDPVQVAATLAGPLYELAGQTDFRRFLRELALQAAKLPDVVGAAVYLASEERMSLAASASEDNATFPGELQQSETEILNSPESGPHPAYVLLSLQDGKQRIGTLLLYHTGSTAISQRTRQAYDLFAVQASLALRTARTFENQRTQGRDLFILYENSRILNSTLDLGIILDRLCENVAFALASDHCIVMLWDQERGEMEYASAFDAINPLQLGSFPVGERFKPAPDSVAGLVMRTGRPIAIDNLSSDPRIGDDRQRLLSFGFKSVLCAPMIQQDNLLGILLVSSNNPRSYSSVEMTLIQTLAGQAAIALGYARVIEEERQRSTEMELLHTLSRELSSGLSVQEAAEAIVRVLERIKPGADFEICVYDSSAQLLRTVVRSASAVDIGSTTGVYTLDEGFSGWLARHRRPLRIDDISGQRSVRPANAEALKKRRIRSFLGVPLLVGDELVGTIELASPKTNAFGPDDELLLMIIAGQAAQAIQNAISFETADEVLRKRIRELTALQLISRKLTSTLYLDDILAAVLAEAQEATAAPAGMVILRDEVAKFAEDLVGSKFAGPAESRSLQMDETGTLRLVAVEGYSDEEQRLLLASLRDPNGPFSLAIAEGKAQIVDDLSEEIASLQLSMQSLLLVPVIYEERIAGIIILGRNSTRAFNRDALEFVRALADQAALAIGNAQHFAELERQRELLQRRASLLNEVLEIGNALRADRELPDLLEQVAFSVADAAGFRSVVFILTDRERPDHMRVVAAAGVPIAKLNRMRSIRISIAALHPFLDQRYRLGRAFFIPKEEAPQDSEIDEILDWQAQTSDTMPGGWQPGDRFLVPLYSTEREMIGLMAIDDPFDRRRPNRRTAEILEIFANQAAIAIENAWLFRDRERQIRGLEAIRRIGQVTSSTLDMDSLLQGVYEVLTDFLPVDSFILHVVDTERKLITRSLIIDLGEVLTVMQEKPVPPKSLTEWLLTNHQPLLFGDINQEISAYPDITPNTIGSGDNAPSWMGVPLLARDDQPIGVMAIQNYRPHAFSQRDLDFMLSVAHQVSLGLQNARLFAETEGHLRQIAEEAERLTTINRVSSLAASTLDFRALCQLAVDEMARATEADQSRLLQFDRSQSIAICRAEYHHTGMVDTLTLPLDTNPTIAWLDREQRPLRVENVATDPVVAPIKETLLAFGIRSMMIVPLVVKGEVIGSVGLDRLNEDRPFSERDAEDMPDHRPTRSARRWRIRACSASVKRRIRELDAINRISQAGDLDARPAVGAGDACTTAWARLSTSVPRSSASMTLKPTFSPIRCVSTTASPSTLHLLRLASTTSTAGSSATASRCWPAPLRRRSSIAAVYCPSIPALAGKIRSNSHT